jgi:hypothetical protein
MTRAIRARRAIVVLVLEPTLSEAEQEDLDYDYQHRFAEPDHE